MTDATTPNFTDSTLYSILIAPSPDVTATYGLTAVGQVATEFRNVINPVNLIVEYGGTSSYSGLTYSTQIFFNGTGPTANYTFAYPQLPAPVLPSLNPTAIGSTGWLIGIGRPN